MIRRAVIVAAAAVAATIASAAPAAAHGVGGRSDLPLPKSLFIVGAAVTLLASFGILRVLWLKPRLSRQAKGRVIGSGFTQRRVALIVLRLVGLVAYGVVLSAAWLGPNSSPRNVAPVALYVAFWVGLQVVSLVIGDLWRALNPFETVASLVERFRPGGFAGGEPPLPFRWIAAAMMFSFVWLELTYHASASPRAVGVWLTGYSIVAVAGVVAWGRVFAREGEGFAALFTLIAHMAPLFVDDRGELRVRRPFSGLAVYPAAAGTAALVLVVLGSTSFDGLTRTQFWTDLAGSRTSWSLTYINTVGLCFVIALVATMYLGAIRYVARIVKGDADELGRSFIASLAPIVVGYSIAHYFSLLVLEGQLFYALISDPYGEGWNLFGTADRAIDFLLVSTDTIAYVQAGAIVVGHVIGVVAAHDRALELYPRRRAEQSQYPMLAAMIAFTVGGLALLLGG